MSGGVRHHDLIGPRLYRAATRGARKPKLTPMEEIELVAWYKAKCAIGTWKSKAQELGRSKATLVNAVERRLGLR